jgi:predicted  nucleic acid-binding Zn-ribbon protein
LREEIARLMSLQAIDRELRELEESLSTIAGRVELLRGETELSQAELDRLTLEDQQSAVERRRLEKELAEGEARIRNKRMRLSQIRNDKELGALQHEVDTLKETNQRLESELLVMMEAADPRAPLIKELTETVEKKRAELKAAEAEIASQVEDLKISISKQHLERDQMAANIDPVLLQRYEMIFSRRGTCQGCRMRLQPQLYNEIQRQFQSAIETRTARVPTVHFCPNCQRILYYDERRAES